MTHLIVELGDGCHLLLLAHIIQLIQAPGLTHLQHTLRSEAGAVHRPDCLDMLAEIALKDGCHLLLLAHLIQVPGLAHLQRIYTILSVMDTKGIVNNFLLHSTSHIGRVLLLMASASLVCCLNGQTLLTSSRWGLHFYRVLRIMAASRLSCSLTDHTSY